MPVSSIDSIPAIINEVYRLQPKTVMELGIGFGKMGVLCREVLDAMHGRCRPDQWETEIYGVEAHEPYKNPCWNVYSRIYIGDFTAMPFMRVDLVLMIDSLEHLDPARGGAFLDAIVANNKHVIVSVPVEPCPQGAVFGNEYETHRTHYNGSEFARFNPVILHRGLCQVMSIKGRA
jgi:hypothetical protein